MGIAAVTNISFHRTHILCKLQHSKSFVLVCVYNQESERK